MMVWGGRIVPGISFRVGESSRIDRAHAAKRHGGRYHAGRGNEGAGWDGGMGEAIRGV
jgi:hypothetical protein